MITGILNYDQGLNFWRDEAEIEKSRQKLSLLLLAESLGSISAACWNAGVSRTQFNDYKRWHQERHIESSKPGKQLNQLTWFAGSFNGIGSIYLFLVDDTCCGVAFGMLSDYKTEENSKSFTA